MSRDYPAEIEDQANSLIKLTSERDAALDALMLITDAITREVIHGTDQYTGKPLYSNDKARELAIREQGRRSPDWVERAERLRIAENARAEAQARLERLRGEFSLHKIERRERIVNIEAAIN